MKSIPTRKLVDRNIRKLTRTGSGGSLCVTIPVDIVAMLKWKDHQKVVVKKVRGGVMIKDWKKQVSSKNLAQFDNVGLLERS